MSSSGREEIVEDFDALRSAVSRVVGHSYDVLTTPERLSLLERLEQETRRLRVPGHELINQIAEQATPEELGGKVSHALADRLRISRGEACRRIAEAADLGPRRAITGEPLPPLLTASAAAQRDGKIGPAHIAVIRQFFDRLAQSVDIGTRECAEKDLAEHATQYRPDQVAKLANRLADCLNPDGNYTDNDRARRRGLILGNQGIDGMSPLRGWLTPEARATLEAVLAKLAAPGMCNPEDDTPVVDGPPADARRDIRSTAQRNHDGLNAALRALLAGGKLGQHNGLPATIIVTTTLKDLQAATGKGLTAGGALLPMTDVIRLARHAHHYLAIFDEGNAIGLYHTKRLASPGQRIVLCAKDRGCTHPGCDVPGYLCEVHHVEDWADTHRTDIDQLTFACGTHHKLLEAGWTTRKRRDGSTEWIPPPHLERGRSRVNTFHHPENLLADDEDGAA
ncbi:HNH endonuclease signature motif containing protein [Mycobacterium sp. Aquia_213]|uniref:HNH endonuclease signature motif containing protein n=1 Tax=Mycobacterium sp. Aquia_213 TaxID=2991728 RepID=UPI002271432F|nr:HNH endonuclease signature motif containing protein [Mycobacterium sp. Aquia_213]WAC93649.1 HNH endonuclease signature motif containing protein [Mycobacterium sp. Aquia_213]